MIVQRNASRGGRVLLAGLLAVAATAAVARGAALPATSSPADRSAWRAILHWPASCQQVWQATRVRAAGISTWSVNRSQWLVAVDCDLGAYQGVAMLYIVKRGRRSVGPLTLPTYRDRGNGVPAPVNEQQILGELQFSPRTSQLSVLDRFRGLGDCGIFSTFQLAGDRLVAIAFHVKESCDGRQQGDPTLWPTYPVPRAD